jgi:sugar phosphate isomerase/epimerase
MSQLTQMGLVLYALNLRRLHRWKELYPDASLPIAMLEECVHFGAGGVQCSIDSHEPEAAAVVRRRAEAKNLHVEAIIQPPEDRADVARFERDIKVAKTAGATLARTVIIPGRRYERFTSLDTFREFEARGLQSLQRAEPILARHRFRLAVENHKDQRISERLELLGRLNSEWVGVCVDLGNSFALLEDPLEVVQAYAPWAMTVHIKDQVLREYQDGFLFGDIALGDGFLDLMRMVKILRDAKPTIRFNLESITRDPLKVPVLNQEYYAPFEDLPASDLGRVLQTIQSAASPEPLETISALSTAGQVAAETRNVQRSINYASAALRL